MKYYTLILILFSLLIVKSNTWEVKEIPSKPYPDTRQEIKHTGKILDKPIQSIEYKGGYYRQWPLYCPLIHRKPKSYGKIK